MKGAAGGTGATRSRAQDACGRARRAWRGPTLSSPAAARPRTRANRRGKSRPGVCGTMGTREEIRAWPRRAPCREARSEACPHRAPPGRPPPGAIAMLRPSGLAERTAASGSGPRQIRDPGRPKSKWAASLGFCGSPQRGHRDHRRSVGSFVSSAHGVGGFIRDQASATRCLTSELVDVPRGPMVAEGRERGCPRPVLRRPGRPQRLRADSLRRGCGSRLTPRSPATTGSPTLHHPGPPAGSAGMTWARAMPSAETARRGREPLPSRLRLGRCSGRAL